MMSVATKRVKSTLTKAEIGVETLKSAHSAVELLLVHRDTTAIADYRQGNSSLPNHAALYHSSSENAAIQ
jgi:hypothetical protein